MSSFADAQDDSKVIFVLNKKEKQVKEYHT